MKKIVVLFLLILCAACSPNNQNNMKDFTYAGNIPIIGDTINNEVVHFIVDSGANISLINSEYYNNNRDEFTLTNEVDLRLFGISGVSETRISHTVILKTAIGSCIFQDSDLSAVINQTNKFGYNVIGLIGSDFLKDDYVINYKTKQISKCN